MVPVYVPSQICWPDVYQTYTCATFQHMSTRIHLVIDERERDSFRARAAAEGMSLSEWLRAAARERLERGQPSTISSVEDLDRFFAERNASEVGTEPDWDQHLALMEQSRSGGLDAT